MTKEEFIAFLKDLTEKMIKEIEKYEVYKKTTI